MITPLNFSFSRRRIQTCKIVLITSLVWLFVYMFILMYFMDCSSTRPCPNLCVTHVPAIVTTSQPLSQRNFFFSFLYKVYNLFFGESSYGEGGRGVFFSGDKQHEADELFKINQFNLMASDLISPNRSLPDYRSSGCASKEYSRDLPKASVIVVFHNEAWSTLTRTLWSIINRSPSHLLEEIILVDDASEKAFLKQELDIYCAKLPRRTLVVRMTTRSGLMKARLKGAAIAQGKALIFLDAHVECTIGWMEPLLHQIHLNPKAVACPIIDVISDRSFEYRTGSDTIWGGFNWRLNFRWYKISDEESERRKGDHTMPLRSPTMAGGLFAIDKANFYHIGAYDPGMIIWGGENVEMSFRVWMCGGEVLISPCSRVGHVFRENSPYTWPGGVSHILDNNFLRTAEVWMDEYKDFLYKVNPSIKQSTYGDVSGRKKLREDLGCKSFRWYLQNIYPSSIIPLNYHSLGSIHNPISDHCIDVEANKQGEKINVVKCHGGGGNQVLSYTGDQQLKSDEYCLMASYDKVVSVVCTGATQEKWIYATKTKTLQNVKESSCLEVARNDGGDVNKFSLSLNPVCHGNKYQQWVLQDLKPSYTT